MSEQHPNIAFIQKVDLQDLSACVDCFATDVTWHFFNPRLPHLEGDYVGLTRLKSFFEKIGALTQGTFQVKLISVIPAGDELVTMHTKNSMTVYGQHIETDVVLVWRIVDGRVKEVWDIPSVYA